MTKKDVSRRGFLKGFVQAAGAMGLATMLKFFPEAKGAFAEDDSIQTDVWPLPSRNAEELMDQTLNDTNSNILRDYLAKQGFSEVPGIYFAQRSRVVRKDKKGNTHRHQTDTLVVGYSSTTQENRGAMLLLVVDSRSTSSQWQVPMIVIQDDALYYVKDENITVYEDKNSPLITAPWFSEFVRGVVPVQGTSLLGINPMAYHGPCSNRIDTCLILGSSCIALLICCYLGGVPCCIGAVGACAASTAACLISDDCCDENPGTHDC